MSATKNARVETLTAKIEWRVRLSLALDGTPKQIDKAWAAMLCGRFEYALRRGGVVVYLVDEEGKRFTELEVISWPDVDEETELIDGPEVESRGRKTRWSDPNDH